MERERGREREADRQTDILNRYNGFNKRDSVYKHRPVSGR